MNYIKCTCGAVSVGGGCSSWCDANTTLPIEENDAPIYAYPPPWISTSGLAPISFPVLPVWKEYKLKLHSTTPSNSSIENYVLSQLTQVPFTEFEVTDFKNNCVHTICTVNGKEHVNFITLTFEEV